MATLSFEQSEIFLIDLRQIWNYWCYNQVPFLQTRQRMSNFSILRTYKHDSTRIEEVKIYILDDYHAQAKTTYMLNYH